METWKKGLICGGVSAAAVLILLCFVFLFPSGGTRRKTERAAKRQESTENAGGTADTREPQSKLGFTAASYQVPANQDTDMNQYLNRQGIEDGDVVWSSDSEKAKVGSQGHLVITDYGVNTVLKAASRTDETVSATCQISTRSEEDDLAYQVRSLNGREGEPGGNAAPNGVSPDAVSPEQEVQPGAEQPEQGTVLLNETKSNTGISFREIRHTPAKRDKSYSWDKSLFYSLEDIRMDSDADGKINHYDVERKKFTNLDSGNQMEYEIYRNPATDKINKIISIEYLEHELEIISYYYTDNGKVNFIFKKKDTNYVPDYASPDRDGERYYFKKDVMVNWRVVDHRAKKSVVSYAVGKKEYDRLKKAGTDQKITRYDECSKSRKKLYDKKERQMLNKAYITFEKVTSSEGISTMYGYVYDGANRPLPHANVDLKMEDRDQVLCGFQTDEEGKYEINVPSREKSYTLEFSSEGLRNQTMYGMSMDETQTNTYGETVYLAEDDGQLYRNTILFYDAAVQYDSTRMMAVDSGIVNMREGINNRSGEIVLTAGFENGCMEAELAAGMYTLEVNSSHYTRTFCNIFVSPNGENRHEIYVSSQLGSDEIRIVLTWGATPPDLDSHLFLPYDGSAGKGASGTAYHIAYYNKRIADGSAELDVDDTDGYGPETITISRLKKGYYKYYVTDYRACGNGDHKSREMSCSSAAVRVYNKNGLMRSFYVPSNRQASSGRCSRYGTVQLCRCSVIMITSMERRGIKVGNRKEDERDHKRQQT